MICTNEQINGKQDSDQEGVNWEDHIGLCYLAAEKMCTKVPRLRPYYMDIAEDLKFVVWKCTQPTQSGKGYCKSKGEFTTYAMRAMRNYLREITVHYLGVNVSRVNGWNIRFHSSDAPSGDGYCMSKGIECMSSTSVEDSIDRQELIDEIVSELPKAQANAFRFLSKTGHNPRSASRAGGCTKYAGEKSIRSAKELIQHIKEIEPDRYSRLLEVVKGVAS